MASQYNLQNLGVNAVTNNGAQQISIQPYKEVTSLNVNQILSDVAGHGASSCQVEFSIPVSPTTLQTVVKAGSVAYFTSEVDELMDEGAESRTYVVKVSFEEDVVYTVDVSQVLPAASIPSEIFRNFDRGSNIGAPAGTHRRVFLVLRYNWEEGMLGSATGAGGGTGGGALGRYARLALTFQTPNQEAQADFNRYQKTVFLGEVLNMGQALQLVGESYVFFPDLLYFRPQPFGHEMLDVYRNLRKANANFKIDINPTADYLYVGPGKAFVGSAAIILPEGLTHRVRVVTPLSNQEANPIAFAPIADSEVEYSTSVNPALAGHPELSSSPIPAPIGPPDPSDIKGQYDVLVLSSTGMVEWLVRAFTYGEDEASRAASIAAASRSSLTQYRRLPQAPGWDENDAAAQVPVVIDALDLRLTRPYIILAVYRRVYYVGEDDYLKLNNSLLPHSSITDTDYIVYEHNPLFPALSVPDTSFEVIITDTLVIPVEEV